MDENELEAHRQERHPRLAHHLPQTLRFALLLLAGCATVQLPCKSTCGVRLFGSNDCAGFQRWEDRAVSEYSAHVPQACDRLFGWVVYVQPGSWRTLKGHEVMGLTRCWEETIYINTDDWGASSYAHEVIHALECPFPDAKHEAWHADWQEQALKKVRGW